MESNNTRNVIELKLSSIISATNTSGNEKLSAIMELFDQLPATTSPPLEMVEDAAEAIEILKKHIEHLYIFRSNTTPAEAKSLLNGVVAAMEEYSQSQPVQAAKWVPIKTQPANGQICILFGEGVHLTFFKFWEAGANGNVAAYFADMNHRGPISLDEKVITHWMPLPEPPTV